MLVAFACVVGFLSVAGMAFSGILVMLMWSALVDLARAKRWSERGELGLDLVSYAAVASMVGYAANFAGAWVDTILG